MKQYNYLQAIYMSFYSRSLYRDVANNWGGGVVLYLLFILIISWAVLAIKVHPIIQDDVIHLSETIGPQLPTEITIKEGEVKTTDNRPYLIREDNKIIAVIDSSGKYKNLEDTPKGTQLLLTKDTVIYIDNHDQVKSQQIPKNLNFDLKQNEIKPVLNKLVDWLWIIILPIIILLSLIYRLIEALIYAVLGKLISAMGGIPLNYQTLLKLSIVILTPALVLATILDFLDVAFHLEWLMYFVISMAYLTFAIGSNRKY